MDYFFLSKSARRDARKNFYKIRIKIIRYIFNFKGAGLFFFSTNSSTFQFDFSTFLSCQRPFFQIALL